MSAYKTSEKEGPDWRISTRQHEKEEASKQDLDYCKLQAEKNFKYNSTLLLARRQTRTQEIEKKSSKNDWVIETDRGGREREGGREGGGGTWTISRTGYATGLKQHRTIGVTNRI